MKKLPTCPVETTLLLISNKWKVLILRELINQPMRFGQLQKSINHISAKVLTANLREMESDKLLIRKVFPEIPPHVEYKLTDLGQSLKPILDSMKDWGSQYQKLVQEKGCDKSIQ